MVSAALSLEGIEAETAANGRIALEKMCTCVVAKESFDVVILDIMMPEVDGWQVLKAIKNNPLWEHTKVIVVSGHSETAEDLMKIIEYDGVYVEKRLGFAETVSTLVTRVLDE